MTTSAKETEPAGPTHRVVVGIDGSKASVRALEWAVAEAARSGAIVEGHASYGSGYLYLSSQDVRNFMSEAIDAAASHVAAIAPGVSFKGVLEEGLASEILVEASKGADLLVVGSRGRGFGGLLLGSVSQQCARHAHCPIVIVPPTECVEQTVEQP
jgi:nucleotide-binding universal stress UspA family protein